MDAARTDDTALHPGQVIRRELNKLGLSANALAQALGVPGNRITAIMREQRGVTADTALRLGRFFSTGPEYWMTLQQNYELKIAETESGPDIAKLVIPHKESRDKQHGE